jgi:hypothetical protein
LGDGWRRDFAADYFVESFEMLTHWPDLLNGSNAMLRIARTPRAGETRSLRSA